MQEERWSSRTGRWAQEPARGRYHGAYGGSEQEADGRQHGTFMRYVGPMRTVNGTPMVGNVKPRQVSNSLKASPTMANAQRRRSCKNKYARCKNGGDKKEKNPLLDKTKKREKHVCSHQARRARGKGHDGGHITGVRKHHGSIDMYGK